MYVYIEPGFLYFTQFMAILDDASNCSTFIVLPSTLEIHQNWSKKFNPLLYGT